jgi:hypothetical protein
MKISFKQILVIIASLVMLTVNALANILPINGMNTGQISDQFKVFFVPAGYVFSIWGVIYLLLIAFTIYQALPAQRSNPLLERVRNWYILGSAANSAWIFFWHYQLFDLTLMMMLTLLVTLVLTYLELRQVRINGSKGMKWLVRLPFSVYLGWITVATVANVTDVLSYHQWNGFGIAGETWAIIMLAVATLLGVLMTVFNRDAAYLAVLVWAFAGIGVKFAGVSPVSLAAYIAAGVAGLLLLACVLVKPKQGQRI